MDISQSPTSRNWRVTDRTHHDAQELRVNSHAPRLTEKAVAGPGTVVPSPKSQVPSPNRTPSNRELHLIDQTSVRLQATPSVGFVAGPRRGVLPGDGWLITGELEELTASVVEPDARRRSFYPNRRSQDHGPQDRWASGSLDEPVAIKRNFMRFGVASLPAPSGDRRDRHSVPRHLVAKLPLPRSDTAGSSSTRAYVSRIRLMLTGIACGLSGQWRTLPCFVMDRAEDLWPDCLLLAADCLLLLSTAPPLSTA